MSLYKGGGVLPVSDKQKQYTDRYIKSTFDELKVRIPKGRKATLQAAASAQGESFDVL
jgi:hypothetical protein